MRSEMPAETRAQAREEEAREAEALAFVAGHMTTARRIVQGSNRGLRTHLVSIAEVLIQHERGGHMTGGELQAVHAAVRVLLTEVEGLMSRRGVDVAAVNAAHVHIPCASNSDCEYQ